MEPFNMQRWRDAEIELENAKMAVVTARRVFDEAMARVDRANEALLRLSRERLRYEQEHGINL